MFITEIENEMSTSGFIYERTTCTPEEICNPIYCLPDAYNVCDPECDEEGGCDPHYDS